MLNDTANWKNWKNKPPANEWVPIGGFQGIFDGSGFVISGVYINGNLRDSTDYQKGGLFMSVLYGAEIKNLGVIASYVKGKNNIGGLAGRSNGEISKCYYVGDVVGYEESSYSESHRVGGIAGTNRGTINNSYSAGTVSGDWQVGGLVGENHEISPDTSGVINNSYYNRETSGQNDKGKGYGKTTAEMKRKKTFKGWDFDSIWKIDAEVNGGYPYLY